MTRTCKNVRTAAAALGESLLTAQYWRRQEHTERHRDPRYGPEGRKRYSSKAKQMNAITKATSVAVLVTLGLALRAEAAEPPMPESPAAHEAEIKIIHDWPGYTGPEGTFADPSRVRLLDDLSQAKLVWTSEHDDLGYGKTTSGGGHAAYGAKSRPGGSCSLIVAGGLVIVAYFNPTNRVFADDVVLALDAATGKTRWKQVYAGKGLNRGAGKHPSYGPTPAAADGRVFHLGSAGRIYALELAGGKPLWEADLGDYPQHFQSMAATAQRSFQSRAAPAQPKDELLGDDKPPSEADLGDDPPSVQAKAAQVQPKDGIMDGLWSVRKQGEGMRQTVNPLIVIDGVLMVPTCQPRLYAYDAATGKELWKLDGVLRVPSPAKINGRTYAFCTGGGFMRLVEPKTGKVLWSEKNNVALPTTHGFVVADGRAFVPYAPGEGNTGPLAAFALSETGAKLLWQSKDTVERIYYAYRDGVIYVFSTPSDSVKTFKADDGTLLSDLSKSGYGQPLPRGDRVVLVGDSIHESLGAPCLYQSCTPGPKDLKLSGKPLAPRTFKSYVGVGGYECVMRPPFADGFMFTRSVDTETGKGVILCWDLRRPSDEEMARRRAAREKNAGQIVESCRGGRTDPVSAVRELVNLDCGKIAEAFLAEDMKKAVGVADVRKFGALAAAANVLGVEASASLGPVVNEALASDRSDLALAAMKATSVLAGAEAEKAKPVLWAFLRGKNAVAWQPAATMLRSMDASADGSIVKEMSRLTKEDGAAVVTAAVDVLGVVAGATPDSAAKKAAIDTLVRHLDSKNLAIQKAAIERLAALGPAAAAAKKKLDDLVELPDLQKDAAKALDAIDPARARKAVEPGLGNPPLDP